jgi:hypothetical protein
MIRHGFPLGSAFTVDPWSEKTRTPAADLYRSALEKDFPHVLETIQTMWGYRELNAYFRKLTLNERGSRDGFPAEVWEDINMLWQLHQKIVPEPLF